MEGVQDEERCEVHPEIGVPIMQTLHYTTNDYIAEMLTNLLSSASIISMVGNAHPAFVEIIKQMSPDEAKIVQYLKKCSEIPYVSLRANVKEPGDGFYTPIDKAVAITSEVDLMYPQNVKIYISNLLSLGVLSDADNLQLVDEDVYEKVIKHNQLDEEKTKYESLQNIGSVDFEKSYYQVTDIGKLFVNACCR